MATIIAKSKVKRATDRTYPADAKEKEKQSKAPNKPPAYCFTDKKGFCIVVMWATTIPAD
ncbi:hypothetical protein J7K27_04420 [Candidatus Bathyarchaeota archaeon]|nr:hypothetical protein [Candidatus Bathyarchaeota archaeon]